MKSKALLLELLSHLGSWLVYVLAPLSNLMSRFSCFGGYVRELIDQLHSGQGLAAFMTTKSVPWIGSYETVQINWPGIPQE